MKRDEIEAAASREVALLRRRRQTDYVFYRVKMLPEQLERARRRVAMLEREALELGMRDLLA